MTPTAPTRPSTVTLDADSADTAYRALADVTVAVTVDDDDAAGLVLNKTSMTIDEDGSGTFTVALATQPHRDGDRGRDLRRHRRGDIVAANADVHDSELEHRPDRDSERRR